MGVQGKGEPQRKREEPEVKEAGSGDCLANTCQVNLFYQKLNKQ